MEDNISENICKPIPFFKIFFWFFLGSALCSSAIVYVKINDQIESSNIELASIKNELRQLESLSNEQIGQNYVADLIKKKERLETQVSNLKELPFVLKSK